MGAQGAGAGPGGTGGEISAGSHSPRPAAGWTPRSTECPRPVPGHGPQGPLGQGACGWASVGTWHRPSLSCLCLLAPLTSRSQRLQSVPGPHHSRPRSELAHCGRHAAHGHSAETGVLQKHILGNSERRPNGTAVPGRSGHAPAAGAGQPCSLLPPHGRIPHGARVCDSRWQHLPLAA